MASFEYTVKDKIGIHARPAGKLVQMARPLSSTIMITKNGMSADATRLMSVLSLGVRCGDTITISAEGGDEEASLEAVKKFMEENL